MGIRHAKFQASSMFRLVCRGGGWFENLAAHLIFGGNLYLDERYEASAIEPVGLPRGTNHLQDSSI